MHVAVDNKLIALTCCVIRSRPGAFSFVVRNGDLAAQPLEFRLHEFRVYSVQ
jgi:hypothetical protein